MSALSSFFFFEVFLENARAVGPTELFCPRDQGAIARDFVMLDGLSRRDQGCVQHFFIVYFAGDLIGFLDDAIYCRTLDAFWLDAVHFEDLLKPFDVIFGLAEMCFKPLLEPGILCFFAHLG